jgi:uncharacterized repeat protein (TIGR01451 family)
VLSGQSVRFTLTVFNAGPSTAQAVTVNDPLGADYRDVVATPSSGTCTTVVTCSLGDVARGESVTITIDATVTANATTLTNVATVGSTTPDPAPANNDASASIVVPPTADLRLTKTPSTTSPTPGQVNGLTYTIVATNAGPSAATGVVISDGLPPDFTPTTISAPAGFACATVAATVVCSGGTIAAGASATLTVTGTVSASPASLTLVNAAEVRADTADPDATNNSDTATVNARPQADLGVTKVWGGTTDPFTPILTTAPNSDVRVLLTMRNFGPSPATGAVLRDPLPAGATFVSSDQPATCNGAGNVVTCNVGALAPGATFTVLVTVHVAAGAGGTTLENTAAGSANEPDPVDSNNSASDRLSVGTAADLAMQKRATPGNASVGDTVTFTLAVTNNGPSDAAAVQITDVLPAGWSFVSSPDCTVAGATVTCVIGTLAAGATREPTVVVRVQRAAAGTTLANSATASSATQDPEPANNTDAAAVVIAPQADLSIVKRASAATVPLFTDVTYTLSIANAGPNDATGVTVTDEVPAGMLFVSADPACTFDAAAASVTCAIGALANGASQDVTVTLRPQPPLAGQNVLNSATVIGAQPDPNLADNSSDARIFVPPQADLAIEKTASATTVVAGGRLTYTLAVTNAGPNTAPSVTVDDPLPAAVTAVQTTASQGSCTIAASGVTCALGDLAAGGRAQVTITVDVATSAAGAPLENTATVDSGILDPRPQDNSASASTDVTQPPIEPGTPVVPPVISPSADLAITKTAPATVAQGGRITWTMTVTNNGPQPSTGSTVTDRIPGPVANRMLTCAIGPLAVAQSTQIVLTGRAPTSKTAVRVTNTATVKGNEVDPVQTNNNATARTRTRAPTLRLTKSTRKSVVRPTEVVGYQIVVRNIGDGAARQVRVCDQPSADLEIIGAPGAEQVSKRRACWVLKLLAAGKKRTLRVIAQVKATAGPGVTPNTATASARNAKGTKRSRASVRVQPLTGACAARSMIARC